jgi:biopolymer transport protein TolR
MSQAEVHHDAQKIVRGSAPRRSADMNVTPLIDVLLVLLVIFMAALPLNQKGIDTNLPAKTRPPRESVPSEQIMLEYSADRRISVNREDVALPELEQRLRHIYADRRDKTMFIAGAPTLRYRDIVAVIDAAKGAGVDRVGIVTDAMRRDAGQVR